MVIRACSEKRGAAAQRAVLAGEGGQLFLNFQFRMGVGQVERRVSVLLGDILEQLVDGGQPQTGEHFFLLFQGVGDVVGLVVIGGHEAVVGAGNAVARRSGLGSVDFTLAR